MHRPRTSRRRSGSRRACRRSGGGSAAAPAARLQLGGVRRDRARRPHRDTRLHRLGARTGTASWPESGRCSRGLPEAQLLRPAKVFGGDDPRRRLHALVRHVARGGGLPQPGRERLWANFVPVGDAARVVAEEALRPSAPVVHLACACRWDAFVELLGQCCRTASAADCAPTRSGAGRCRTPARASCQAESAAAARGADRRAVGPAAPSATAVGESARTGCWRRCATVRRAAA